MIIRLIGCFNPHDGVLVLHGGAGKWPKDRLAKALEAIKEAAYTASSVVPIDPLYSVVKAVKAMEDSSVFNAGVGSVTTLEGFVEMDAGVMSSDGLVGAVAATSRIRNPVLAAYVVALETKHIILVGEGAEELALNWGVERLEFGERFYEIYARTFSRLWRRYVSDTVGAVAVKDDVLAAAVSTGGIRFKLRGRVGDSAIPGAGFYADNRVACAATGVGETIIMGSVCRKIAELSRNYTVFKAVKKVIEEHTRVFGRDTLGVIIVDKEGCAYTAVNTEHMPVAIAAGNVIMSFDAGEKT